ncbi:MAG: efflux RND transporter permease subunit, partial [Rickettsiales bacterium]|nr:efflux RND transporter permease subunit [Rickettsiales bacterium]
MIETFVKRHVTTLMFVVFLIIMGLVALMDLNVEKDPQIDYPVVVVTATYPGASPDEVQKELLEEIEEVISEVSEIKKMNSRAYENFGMIMLEFNLEADANIKAIEVKDKVEGILNDLPANAERPIIEKFDVFGDPVLELSLKSDKHDGKYLYNFADNKLKGILTSIAGVSRVDISGGRERAIRIKLDPERMKQKFITILDVVAAIEKYNINIPSGKIRRAQDEIGVRFFAEFQNLNDIENMLITTSEGQEFKLKDVADIRDDAKDLETDAFYNRDPIVLMLMHKVSGGNEIVIADGFYKKLETMKSILEDGMVLDIISDNTEEIRTETKSTFSSIVMGILLTIFVLIVFTANFRTTFITALIIPSSIVSTFFLIKSADFTINSMTLLGLATVLGTLIANAIIIIENSLSFLRTGSNPYDAAIIGTKRSIVPVLASSGTNLAVFIPIAFMGGVVGRFMVQFGMTVVFATLLSIVISFTLTPMLIARLLKSQNENYKRNIFDRMSDNINSFIQKEYHAIFGFLFRFKFISFVLCMVVFVCTMMLNRYIGGEFMPMSDNDKIVIEVKTPEGSSIEKTTSVSDLISAKVMKHKEVKSVITQIGENGVQNAFVTLMLTPAKTRISDVELISVITPEFADIPDAEITIKRGQQGRGANFDITMNLYGIEYDKMVEYAQQIISEMETMEAFRSVSSNYREPGQEYRFIPDQNKLNLYGVSNEQIAATIRYSLYGNDNSTYRDVDIYDILIELNDSVKNNDAIFNNILVASQKGMIPITELGEIRKVKSYSELRRRDRQSIIEIGAQIGKGTAGQVQAELSKSLADKIKFENGYGYYYAGTAEMQAETGGEIAKAFLLAIIFTYMVLAAIMNSFIHPFTIALSILTSFSGVFVLMFFTGTSINIGSMLAFIMLVGLTVNAAILLLEPAMAKIETGKSIELSLLESADE